MADLNVMLVEHAKSGLKTRLDAAVTNGDTEEAGKVAAEMAKLELATAPAPKAGPAYGNTEITAELDKLPWFGIDPKKSARVVELGKTMNPKKFSTAAEFTAALVKAVDEEFKPAGGKTEDDEEEPEEEAEPEDEETPKPKPKPRRSDAPGEADTTGARARRTAGPWAKLSDAPADVAKEIRRMTDKHLSSGATKESREKFISNALEASYGQHQRNKARK